MRIPIVDVFRQYPCKLSLGLRTATFTFLLSRSVTVIVPSRDATVRFQLEYEF